MSDFEYELAKQSPLSDSITTLNSQYDSFNDYIKTVTKSLPGINEVLDKAKENCSSSSSDEPTKLKEDIVKYYNDTRLKLDLVNKCFKTFCLSCIKNGNKKTTKIVK